MLASPPLLLATFCVVAELDVALTTDELAALDVALTVVELVALDTTAVVPEETITLELGTVAT